MKVRTGYYGKIRPGKSVMIKCLIGLETADSGSIMVMGEQIGELSRTTLDEIRTEIGFLFRECIV
jgi:phospholipid/cholesterol/gamma-HCH transport system ATP-binding protein